MYYDNILTLTISKIQQLQHPKFYERMSMLLTINKVEEKKKTLCISTFTSKVANTIISKEAISDGKKHFRKTNAQ